MALKVELDSKGKRMTPRGIRNNNPGNLDNTNPWQGLVANKNESRFATFKDATWGIRALAVTLITYHDKRKAKDGSRIDTIREVVERWAPPSENDTTAYVKAVSKAVGVSPDMEIDLHQYQILKPTVEAIIRHENGQRSAEDGKYVVFRRRHRRRFTPCRCCEADQGSEVHPCYQGDGRRFIDRLSRYCAAGADCTADQRCNEQGAGQHFQR
jgi:hypothetical protein